MQKVYFLWLMPVCGGYLLVFVSPPNYKWSIIKKSECKASCRLHLIILSRRNIGIVAVYIIIVLYV
jgi:hypothetical protein